MVMKESTCGLPISPSALEPTVNKRLDPFEFHFPNDGLFEALHLQGQLHLLPLRLASSPAYASNQTTRVTARLDSGPVASGSPGQDSHLQDYATLPSRC
jgi:hypothetical protein